MQPQDQAFGSDDRQPGVGIPAQGRSIGARKEARGRFSISGWAQPKIEGLAIRINGSIEDGPVAVLGAAGKGVTLANLLDPDGQLISCLVDLNPHKQQKFLPGTGHPIVLYEEMKAYGITSAVLLNPNYYDDTIQLLKRHQLSVRLITNPIPYEEQETTEQETRARAG